MATARQKSRTKYFTAEEALEAIVNGLDVADGNESEAEELELNSDDEEEHMDIISDTSMNALLDLGH